MDEHTTIGLDISTKTGFAVLRFGVGGRCQILDQGIIQSKAKGFARWAEMAEQLMVLVNRYSPQLIVVEGYGFANKHTLATLVEVGTVLRYFLWQDDRSFVIITPNTLKKFVTGKGNAKKDLMIKEIYKRWGHDVESHDEADAIGLAYVGMALMGKAIGLPKVQVDVLKKPMESLTLIANTS